MTLKGFTFYIQHPILALKRIGLALYEKTHPTEPWFSQGSVRKLEELLTSDMMVFEWGSGRSTLWFASRVRSIVSIEYNQEWAQKVTEMIANKNVNNVDLKYIPLDHAKNRPTPRVYDPLPKYVSEIFNYPKESFDLVIVDGHYRLTCVDQCLEHIKPGGYLLIDNSNRVPRHEWPVPQDWPLIHESENVVTRTSIWQKTK